MSESQTIKQRRLVPWFGCDLAVAGRIAELLDGCAHVTIPFAGSAAVVPFLPGRVGVLNDLHRHVANLFRCIKLPEARDELLCYLDATLFHPDELARAQLRCLQHENEFEPSLFGPRKPAGDDDPDPRWAADYFIAAWMGRGGHSGKGTEFTQNLAVRHTASGGGSAKRFQSAIESLDGWSEALKRWDCTCMDALALLDVTPDRQENGIYCDPPWPGAGDEYKHKFSDYHQRHLARKLASYNKTRVVVRNEDSPFIRKLYDGWKIERHTSRSQQNTDVAELLISK